MVSVRSVKCQNGVYPFRVDPRYNLELHDTASGGEESKSMIESISMHESESKEPIEAELDFSKPMKPPDKHPNGSLAMTTIGLCSVQGRYKDGDYQVTFPEGQEPQEVHSVKPKDLWVPSEWPDWSYDNEGNRIGDDHDYKHDPIPHKPKFSGLDTALSGLSLAGMKVQNLYGEEDEQEKTKYPNTRSTKEGAGLKKMKAHRANMRGPSQYKIWDRGKEKMTTVHYPYLESSNPKACLLYTSPSPRDLSTSRMPSSA